jgi:hypothetical protein
MLPRKVLGSRFSVLRNPNRHPERSEDIREADVLAQSKDPLRFKFETGALGSSHCASDEFPYPFVRGLAA